MKRSYYHKTVVVKDIFSGTLIYTVTILVLISFIVSVLGRFNIKPADSYITQSFKELLAIDSVQIVKQKNIYDLFSQIVPLVKSSDEMMKKYEALYGGVKKDGGGASSQPGFLEGKQVEEIDMSKQGIVFNNSTTYPMDLQKIKNTPLEFSHPAVLIVHTHTSEAYAESPGARSTQNFENVVRIGEIIKERLQTQGINVIHDTTQNDSPSYNGSYNKAMGVIQRNIAENENIQVVLDVHRDYTARESNGLEIQLKPVSVVDGKKTAQVMLVVGTDNSGLTHPAWRHNLAFAVKINEELDNISENIARPINIRKERFNQHLAKGSLILEIGAASNALAESENAAVYLGDAIASVLKKY